jgi:hypothetical protein
MIASRISFEADEADEADEGIRTLDLRHGKAGKDSRGPQVRAVRGRLMALIC